MVGEEQGAGPVCDAGRGEYFSDVFVAAVGIGAPGPDAVMVIVPTPVVLAIAVFVPTFVLSIVMPVVAAIFVLFPAFMFPVVMALVLVLTRRGDRQGTCYGHENHS